MERLGYRLTDNSLQSTILSASVHFIDLLGRTLGFFTGKMSPEMRANP